MPLIRRGMSGNTYDQAKKVVEAAEADAGLYGDLVEKMDETGLTEQVGPATEPFTDSRSIRVETRRGNRPVQRVGLDRRLHIPEVQCRGPIRVDCVVLDHTILEETGRGEPCFVFGCGGAPFVVGGGAIPQSFGSVILYTLPIPGVGGCSCLNSKSEYKDGC